ncbi:hypothetical protein HY624_02450 [Candidatus Uhrbacteria bacterium]|nr:hypothetical protein [Candidatus Uhrbacteria bacterium]
MSPRRILSRNRKDSSIRTIVDIDGEPVVPIPEMEPILVRLSRRLQCCSPFAWGFIAGVAVMSALFGLALVLLFRSLT